MDMLTPQGLAFHYKQSYLYDSGFSSDENSKDEVYQLIHEMMNYGYIPSEDFMKLLHQHIIDIRAVYKILIPILQNSVGANVIHKPMYPNFPEQVIEMDDMEWIVNAIFHYWSAGEWMPEYEAKFRKIDIEPNVKYKEIDIISKSQLAEVIRELVKSPNSLTEFDKQAVNWGMEHQEYQPLDYSSETPVNEIPFAETRCIVLAHLMKQKNSVMFNEIINNITDVLRVATFLSGGDVSLAKNTKFKNFKRSERRFLTNCLEIFWDGETAVRHKNKWVKLLHSLHVGDYSQKMWENARKLRENEYIETFNGLLEHHIREKNFFLAITYLEKRPSEFARRLDHLMREVQEVNPKLVSDIIVKFDKVIGKVPTKILVQLMGHFSKRTTGKVVVLPKGRMAKAVLIQQKGDLYSTEVLQLISVLEKELIYRFADISPIGKVWVDPMLRHCPVPSAMRSITDGLVTVPRGTSYPLPDDKVLRLFAYWKNPSIGDRVDIDLSVTFHDSTFKMIGQVDYTHLRDHTFGTYHSGDITNAPEGASEFIDIDLDVISKMKVKKPRYAIMNVLSFSHHTYEELGTAFVGYMGRSEPQSNEIFEPKTVKYKLDLVNDTKFVCPLVFDLEEKRVIFVDMTKSVDSFAPNNVANNRAGIEDILFSIINPQKMSLYELFNLHIRARGDWAESKEEADFTCGLEDCDITPENWLEIQNDWIG